MVVSGKIENPNRENDIQECLQEFDTTMTKEPGLTTLGEFGIGKSDIAQRPHLMPQALRDSVIKELDWLLKKGQLRESTSQWALPMVTVQKPDGSARVYLHFRRINGVTSPLPFYMPRVDEVVEQVERCKVISKLDISIQW